MLLYTCAQVLGFFFLCVWLVPFSIFISLSANDMVLPTLGAQDGLNTGTLYRGDERRGEKE